MKIIISRLDFWATIIISSPRIQKIIIKPNPILLASLSFAKLIYPKKKKYQVALNFISNIFGAKATRTVKFIVLLLLNQRWSSIFFRKTISINLHAPGKRILPAIQDTFSIIIHNLLPGTSTYHTCNSRHIPN